MVKTSITSYVVAGIIASSVIATFVFFYVSTSFNYDVSDIDTSTLSGYSNFSEMSALVNESSSQVYDVNADSGLFDVLGGLVVKSLNVIKAFISGIKFFTASIGVMLSGGMYFVPYPVKIAVILIITISIAGVLLFRYIANKEDEKP